MYFFWIENVDNGYSNYLGGQSLRSGKLISLDGKFQSIMSDFNISQYDEITTSHNGFLTMSVEYGILPVAFLLLSFIYLIFNNLNKNHPIVSGKYKVERLVSFGGSALLGPKFENILKSVSYTHLTLPTKRIV